MPSDDALATAARERPSDPPAPIGRRIGAAVVDGVIAGLFAILGVGISSGLAGACVGPGCEIIVVLGLGGAVGALAIVQAFLIATRGHSIGKRLAGLRITRDDGSPAGLVRGAILRTLPLLVVPGVLFGIGELVWQAASADADHSTLVRWFGYGGLSNLLTVVPAIASALFVIADAALALGPARRALHDRLAGTVVTRAPGPGELAGAS
jgi:uncharacterized RDD family membrane protein YckC